jgi:hypothetical protein
LSKTLGVPEVAKASTLSKLFEITVGGVLFRDIMLVACEDAP